MERDELDEIHADKATFGKEIRLIALLLAVSTMFYHFYITYNVSLPVGSNCDEIL